MAQTQRSDFAEALVSSRQLTFTAQEKSTRVRTGGSNAEQIRRNVGALIQTGMQLLEKADPDE